MHPKVLTFIGIGLRIFTFICLLIALAVIASDKASIINGTKFSFDDFDGYRYVLSIAVIGLTYTMLQLVFSIYHVVTNHIPFWSGFPQFNYYADQVITWVFATAAGAGFAVSAELKQLFHPIVESNLSDYVLQPQALDQQKSLVDDFFNKANISSAMIFISFLSMAFFTLLSSFFNRPKSTPPAHDLEAQYLKAQTSKAQSPQAQYSQAQQIVPQSPQAQPLELSSA